MYRYHHSSFFLSSSKTFLLQANTTTTSSPVESTAQAAPITPDKIKKRHKKEDILESSDPKKQCPDSTEDSKLPVGDAQDKVLHPKDGLPIGRVPYFFPGDQSDIGHLIKNSPIADPAGMQTHTVDTKKNLLLLQKLLVLPLLPLPYHRILPYHRSVFVPFLA